MPSKSNFATNRGQPIGSVTLMVCTYRRPEAFQRFLQSVGKLNIPENIKFHVVVSDNNSESHYDTYIEAALTQMPFAHSYGHEPEAGYSNARNKALELALATPADLFAFSDDDMELDPGWLAGHLQSHAEFGCDIVGGTIEGHKEALRPRRRWTHGQECETQGAGNVSFRRWIVDPGGLALRFDPQFNKLGREDQAFFTAARARGARIIFSIYPVIFDRSMMDGNWLNELYNKAEVSAIMHRNDVVKIRLEKGCLPALAVALWSLRFGFKYLAGIANLALCALLGQEHRAELGRLSLFKNKRKMIESFKGLGGNYIPRGDVRR